MFLLFLGIAALVVLFVSFALRPLSMLLGLVQIGAMIVAVSAGVFVYAYDLGNTVPMIICVCSAAIWLLATVVRYRFAF